MTEEKKTTLFNDIGEMETIKKVHKIFYDKIYSHNWIGKFFLGIPQEVIETQQTDFMAQSFGGPKMYLGKFPVAAHKHMLITDELFELRKKMLEESLIEANVSLENRERWLKIDSSFRGGIVKKSIGDCEKRFNSDEIQSFDEPMSYKKAGNL
jgi:truncated hemoglobin YjbI